jgi:hypothetical protein
VGDIVGIHPRDPMCATLSNPGIERCRDALPSIFYQAKSAAKKLFAQIFGRNHSVQAVINENNGGGLKTLRSYAY